MPSIRVDTLLEARDAGLALELVGGQAGLSRRITGPRVMSSSRNEFMSAPMAAWRPPVPPLLEMLSLVSAGLALRRVMALKKLLELCGTAPPAY